MSDLVKSLLREFAQKLVGAVVVWLVAHGLDVPAATRDWAVLALITGGLFLWTAIVRWLETRYGTSRFAGFLRKVARVLMLGINAKPVYVQPGTKLATQTDHTGKVRTVR